MTSFEHTHDAQDEQSVDPNLVKLLLAIEATELRLKASAQPFDAYVEALLNKASLEQKISEYRDEKRGYNPTRRTKLED